jgi:Tol biopolymer transport system component
MYPAPLRARSILLVVSWLLLAGCGRRTGNASTTGCDGIRQTIAARFRAQFPTPVSVSHDGTRVLLRTADWKSDQLNLVSVQTGQRVAQTNLQNTPLSFSWSAIGDKVGFFLAEGNGGLASLYLWDFSTNKPKSLTAPGTQVTVQAPKWSPDGHYLAYLVGTVEEASLWVVSSDNHVASRPIIANVRSRSDFDWSPSGQEIAVVLADSPGTLRIIAVKNGKLVRELPMGGAKTTEIRDLSWAPNGSAIALSAHLVRDHLELIKLDLETGKTSVCVSAQGDVAAPHFAPDSRTIIYSLAINSQITLHYTRCDGSASREIGFDSGTSRFLKFLQNPWTHSGKPIYAAVLHVGLEEPPSLQRVALRSGVVPELIYSSQNSGNLRSRPPRVVKITSNDGVQIPTIFWEGDSDNSSPPVALVDLHGGPHLQTNQRWDFLPALLTSSGFDVLSPNYSGSTGYGYKYEQSGDADQRMRDVIAVCKFAKSMHGGHTRVILMGTSYGSYLAASAAATEPQDISGLILTSLIDERGWHPNLDDPPFPVFCFHGQNDQLLPGEARKVLFSFFGTRLLDDNRNSWRVFPSEGHVFRHMYSWTEVYDAVLTMASRITGRKFQCCNN